MELHTVFVCRYLTVSVLMEHCICVELHTVFCGAAHCICVEVNHCVCVEVPAVQLLTSLYLCECTALYLCTVIY